MLKVVTFKSNVQNQTSFDGFDSEKRVAGKTQVLCCEEAAEHECCSTLVVWGDVGLSMEVDVAGGVDVVDWVVTSPGGAPFPTGDQEQQAADDQAQLLSSCWGGDSNTQ